MKTYLSRIVPPACVLGAVLALTACTGTAPTTPSPSLDPPPTATEPPAWAGSIEDCMLEDGWEVEVFSDGGVTPPDGLSATELEDYDEALASCREQIEGT